MHLAEALVRSNHNITIVDPHEELLKMMESHTDLMTITGDSTSTAVLQRANVKRADLVIAVLHDEHINLLTGIIAKKLGAKKVIVRVNTMENLSPEVWRMYQDLGIDGLLSRTGDYLTAEEERLIRDLRLRRRQPATLHGETGTRGRNPRQDRG